jgi:hypothetical protein
MRKILKKLSRHWRGWMWTDLEFVLLVVVMGMH